jgi:hypothetical protein
MISNECSQRLALILLKTFFLILLVFLHFTLHPSGSASGNGTQYGTNRNYMTLDHAYDYLWEEEAVRKGGHIRFSGTVPDGYPQSGSISMYDQFSHFSHCSDAIIFPMLIRCTRFHQLHCLGSFRKALQDAYEGKSVAFDWHDDIHWPHCLHYLHQVRCLFIQEV